MRISDVIRKCALPIILDDKQVVLEAFSKNEQWYSNASLHWNDKKCGAVDAPNAWEMDFAPAPTK